MSEVQRVVADLVAEIFSFLLSAQVATFPMCVERAVAAVAGSTWDATTVKSSA